MTLEEMVIAVRVTADGAQETLDALRSAFSRLGETGQGSLLGIQRGVRDLMKWIDYMRHTGQASAQQEIAMLEAVRRNCQLTAEQIMEIDKRIYDAREKLRKTEAGKITAYYDALVDALKNRYEEQRGIEKNRISESVSAWQAWSREACGAIEKQIAALDEQAQAQDRAAAEAEHLRRIDKLRQALLYEQDGYNRSQLQAQLRLAQEEWAAVQRDFEREETRAALHKQLQAIEEKASAEIGLLQEEARRIDSVYDVMLKGQSLAAEAQKLLMESSQEDLLSLLSSYAPDYEATGRTLGERIYEGFKSAFGDISAFFEQIDAQFESMAESAGQAAFGSTQRIQASGQAQANVAAPTINQTVNFNQPVESPADVTRRMQQVSEELAGMV